MHIIKPAALNQVYLKWLSYSFASDKCSWRGSQPISRDLKDKESFPIVGLKWEKGKILYQIHPRFRRAWHKEPPLLIHKLYPYCLENTYVLVTRQFFSMSRIWNEKCSKPKIFLASSQNDFVSVLFCSLHS
jgi:hypothetical protein